MVGLFINVVYFKLLCVIYVCVCFATWNISIKTHIVQFMSKSSFHSNSWHIYRSLASTIIAYLWTTTPDSRTLGLMFYFNYRGQGLKNLKFLRKIIFQPASNIKRKSKNHLLNPGWREPRLMNNCGILCVPYPIRLIYIYNILGFHALLIYSRSSWHSACWLNEKRLLT